MKKIIIGIFVVIFLAVFGLVAKTIYDSVYDSIYEKEVAKRVSTNEAVSEELDIESSFSCGEPVSSVSYVYLRGFRNHNVDAAAYQKELAGSNPVLDFEYDENQFLEQIRADFVTKFDTFVSENPSEKVVLLGYSAGGIVLSAALASLEFDGVIEAHTIASPTKGYGASEEFISMEGFGKEIGLGFRAFEGNPNAVVFHHKTVTDSSLASWCGDYEEYCDIVAVQNNNIAGASEYYYPDDDHASIERKVSKAVIECDS